MNDEFGQPFFGFFGVFQHLDSIALFINQLQLRAKIGLAVQKN